MKWQPLALFAAAIGSMLLIFLLGFTVRAPLAGFIPGSVGASKVSARFVGSAASSWGTLGLLGLAIAAYVVALVAVWRGLPRAFLVVIASCAVLSASLIPLRPLVSPDAIHLAADVRTLWIHHTYPGSNDGVPANFDDPVANRVRAFRYEPSGYGPLAYAIGGLPLPFVGDNFAANIGGVKVVAAIFLVITAALTGLLASALERNRALAAAAVGLNPMLLYFFPGEGHNDVIMASFGVAAVLFALRPGPRALAASGAFLVASILSKFAEALLLPFMAIHQRPQWRSAITVLTIVAGVVVVLLLLGDRLPGGSAGPATTIADATPWHIAVDAATGPNGIDKNPWLAVAYTGALGTLTLVLLSVPMARNNDFVHAVALFGSVWMFTSFPGLLPWYPIWFLPFAVVSDRRWLAVGSLVFMSCYALQFVAAGADQLGVRPSFARAVSIAIVVQWVVTIAVAGAIAWWDNRGTKTAPATISRTERGRATRTAAARARRGRAKAPVRGPSGAAARGDGEDEPSQAALGERERPGRSPARP